MSTGSGVILIRQALAEPQSRYRCSRSHEWVGLQRQQNRLHPTRILRSDQRRRLPVGSDNRLGRGSRSRAELAHLAHSLPLAARQRLVAFLHEGPLRFPIELSLVRQLFAVIGVPIFEFFFRFLLQIVYSHLLVFIFLLDASLWRIVATMRTTRLMSYRWRIAVINDEEGSPQIRSKEGQVMLRQVRGRGGNLMINNEGK